MDISRHKGPAYESEGSNAEAIMELSASRRNIMDDSGKGILSSVKSFKRDKPDDSAVVVATEDSPDDVEKPTKDVEAA